MRSHHIASLCILRIVLNPARYSSNAACRQKFVLQVLSETAVFIKRAKEDWLKAEITQWQQAISYENAETKA